MGLQALTYDEDARLRVAFVIMLVGSLALAGSLITERELRIAVLVYAITEVTVLFTPFVQGNPNGIAFRVLGAVLAIWVLLPRVAVRLILIAVAGASYYIFQGRTAAVGFIAALSLFYLLNLMAKVGNWIPKIVFSGALILIVYIFSSDRAIGLILDALPDNAIDLVGKGRDLGSTYLDPLAGRRDFWDYSISLISSRPITGWGPGIQIGDFNPLWAHNAYYRILIEIGIPLGILWISIYALATVWSFRGNYTQSRASSVCGITGIYMLVCGLLESIGMGSALVPSNAVFFVSLFCYVREAKASPNPEKGKNLRVPGL
jgi:O-antigen ligase